jgi:hypothetical protein
LRRAIDVDLQRVLNAWPTLPPALRAGILAMIDAARKDGEGSDKSAKGLDQEITP